MLDSHDLHDPLLAIETVDDPIGAPSCRPVAQELSGEGFSKPFGCLKERPDEELDDRDGYPVGKTGEAALSGTGDLKLPPAHLARYLALRSSLVRNSPLAISA